MSKFFRNTRNIVYPVLLYMVCFNAPASGAGFPHTDGPLRDKVYAKSISGKVTGENGEPLPGVSVLVKGAASGTKTDADGNFTLSAPDGATTLVISHIGYISQEVPIGSKSSIDIILKSSDNKMNEVVVVGYGTQRKSDLTGSIVSIKGSDMTQLPVQRADQALQGRAAGVMVLNTDGSPGGNTTIRVRGLNSINGDNSALIVIDGVQGGNLNSLNPNDIANVEILKDASATAIYGSQGANGVILITTRTGVKGKTKIDYSYNLGKQTLGHKLKLMDAADFASVTNAYNATQDLAGTVPPPIFTDDQIAGFKKNGGTDWQNAIYRTATIQNHQLSISGGSDNVRYMISGAYMNQQGILINSSYKRYSIRANVDGNINSWASFGLNWYGAKEAGNSPPFGNSNSDISWLGAPINTAPRWGATIPVYQPDGSYTKAPANYGANDTWNPVASAREPQINNGILRNTIGAYLEFRILEGLKLRITGGALITSEKDLSYYNTNTYQGLTSNGYGLDNTDLNARYQNSNILTYDKTFNKHHLTLTGVAEQQYTRDDATGLVAKNFTVDQTNVYDMGGAGNITNSSSAYERVLNSYLGRINYSYADRYLFTASYRADGSSVFGPNNKWGYFPSASAAWHVSEEGFMKEVATISDLKVRGSWGITGNQAIAPYQTLAKVATGAQYSYPYDGTDADNLGYVITSAANPNLKWESTKQVDVGIDVGLFKNRLTATVDYYDKTTRDLLLLRQLPTMTGIASVMDNVGSVSNKGWEATVSGDILTGAVKWNSSFNISANRNKVLDIGASPYLSFRTTQGGYQVGNILYLYKGQPFGQMYGYGYEGVWNTKDAAAAAAFGELPGDPKYTDVNKDGKINSQDLKVIGNAFPKYIFGWNNRVSYKDFDLNFLIQGTQGNDLFNMTRIRIEAPYEGTSPALLNRWTPDHQNTNIPGFISEFARANANLTSTVSLGGGVNQLSHYVENGSYIRMKNITLGYNLPRSVVSKIGFSRIRAYISAMNLFTITKYTGYDPESSAFTNQGDTSIGIDFGNYPSARTYTAGLDISF